MSEAGDPRQDAHWSAVRAAATAPAPTPPGLVARVLTSVRGMRGKLLAEGIEVPQDGGTLRVGERAIVALTRQAGSEMGAAMGGIYVSAVSLEPGGLEVLIAVRYGIPASTMVERLRVRLAAELAQHLGSAAPPLSLHIVDVYRH